MKPWIAVWNILKKDMKTYYLKPPNISWGIIFPFAWTLMTLLRSQGQLDVYQVLPGVMAMSILFGTTSMLAVTITFERRSRCFERLLLAPINLNLLILAKISGAIIFGVCNAFVPVVIALFVVDLAGVNWGLVCLSVLLMAIASTLLGLFVAVSVREVFEAQTFSNFFRFPMLFLCGLFIPISQLPALIRPLSYLLPLTYGVNLLQIAVVRTGTIDPWFSVLALGGFIAVLFTWSMARVKRRWIV